ncbi:SPOSA6832_00934 [Sporobolomyces salmonicolor]|uniref:SPOSA6832_00934-mRNA-1:cds n=1 Tax=Sporidiobolus salmonicolor TaxID=5005 RepID=A0A0D6EHB1_SPOSA|nr:SPOSA6832_00934 [Sporobolomyces salmonicolor]
MAKGISKRKQTRNFLKSGALSSQIEARHKRKQFEQKKKGRDARRQKGVLPAHQREEDVDSEDEFVEMKKKQKEDEESEEEEMGVDDVLGAEELENGEGDEPLDHSTTPAGPMEPLSMADDDSDLEDDDLSNLSDAESDSSSKHMADLKSLAEKDPEFFKYLQENDAELLGFGDGEELDMPSEEDEDEDESEDEDEGAKKKSKKAKGKEKERENKTKKNILTKELLKTWQATTLETRSFKALRKLLLAFRSAAQSGLDEVTEGERYEIQSPAVFNKLIVTTLKYTPVVFAAQVPFKEVNGKYKLSTNSKQYATAQRLIKSYFVSLQALLSSTSSDSGIPALAVSESAKLVPWVVGNRKSARGWVKMLLGLYDSATDEVRVAAFLALRKLAVAADHSLRESVIKVRFSLFLAFFVALVTGKETDSRGGCRMRAQGTYATLLASSRQTSVYTLPAITLMKNSASELFLLPGKQESDLAYQLAFGYIRSLAILLRKGVKEASKVGEQEAFKSVYNWQFVHAVDFWSLVLSASCDKQRVAEQGESPLQQLLYPLIQVALGAIRLVPTSRYYPLRFHLIRSLLRIVQRTGTYIPLAASLFEILDSPELTKRLKPSTLKPLDWDYYLKCPAAYQRTRVYSDALVEELVYLLTEFYGALSTSIAFPELALPAVVSLKRHAKKTGQAKLASLIKTLVDKLESNSRWIEERRDKVEFAPNKRDKVERFLQGEDLVKTPMGTHLKLQRKVKEAKRATLERAAHAGEDI